MFFSIIKSKNINIISIDGNTIESEKYGDIKKIIYKNDIVYSIQFYLDCNYYRYCQHNSLDLIPDNSTVTGIIEDIYKVDSICNKSKYYFSINSVLQFPSIVYYYLVIGNVIESKYNLLAILDLYKNDKKIMEELIRTHRNFLKKVIIENKSEYLNIIDKYNKSCNKLNNDNNNHNVSILVKNPNLITEINNKNLILEVLKYNISIYNYLPESSREDIDIIFQAIKYNHHIIPNLSKKYTKILTLC